MDLDLPRILVLGIGNVTQGDEGIAVHLARSLRDLLGGVEVEDATPRRNDFLELFRAYDALILLEPIALVGDVGRVLVLSPYALRDMQGGCVNAGRCLEEALEEARLTGHSVPRIEVIGICVREGEWTEGGLSPELADHYVSILAAVRRTVERIVAQCGGGAGNVRG